MINSINEEKEFQKANNLFEKMESKKKRSDNGTVVEYTKKNDDATFGIVKEGSLYTIKVSGKKNPVLVAEDFDYVEGYEARKRFQRSTLQEAIKYLHLYLNEEKYVVDVPVVTQQTPAPEIPAIDNPQDMGADSPEGMGDENMDMSNDTEMDGEAEDDDQKEIQKMTGKLAQDLRQEIQDGKEEFTVGMFKSIIAAAKDLPSDLKSEVMGKAQEVLSSEEGAEAAGGEDEMNEAFWSRGSKGKNYEKIGFEVPNWAVGPLTTNDYTGLDTAKEMEVKHFKDKVNDKYGNYGAKGLKFDTGEGDVMGSVKPIKDVLSPKEKVYVSVPKSNDINEEKGGFEKIPFVVPEWSLSYLINGDASGLEDEDIEKLEKFTRRVVNQYGNANFSGGSEEDALGFRYKNDIDNLGSNVFEVYILVPKQNDNTEEMYESYNQTRKIAKLLSEEKKQKQYTDEEVEKMVSQLALKIKTAEKAYAQVLPEDTEIKDMLNKLYHKLFNIKTIKSRKEEISKKKKTAVQQKESAVQSTVNHIMSRRPKDITEEGSAIMSITDFNKVKGGTVRVVPDDKATKMQTTGKLQETKKMTVGGLKSLMESMEPYWKDSIVFSELRDNLQLIGDLDIEELMYVGKITFQSSLQNLDSDTITITYQELANPEECKVSLKAAELDFYTAYKCKNKEQDIEERIIELFKDLEKEVDFKDNYEEY